MGFHNRKPSLLTQSKEKRLQRGTGSKHERILVLTSVLWRSAETGRTVPQTQRDSAIQVASEAAQRTAPRLGRCGRAALLLVTCPRERSTGEQRARRGRGRAIPRRGVHNRRWRHPRVGTGRMGTRTGAVRRGCQRRRGGVAAGRGSAGRSPAVTAPAGPARPPGAPHSCLAERRSVYGGRGRGGRE